MYHLEEAQITLTLVEENGNELELGELQDLQYEPSTKKQTNDLKGDIQSWIDRKKTRSRNSESFSSNF